MLQWEEFTKCATRLEVPTEQYSFSVLLFSDYMTNCLNALAYRHFHVNYEVLYFRKPGSPEPGFFRLIPPMARHAGALSSQWDGYFLTTFQFSIHERTTAASPSVLDNYHRLTEPVDVPDSFGGGWIMERSRTELERQEAACFETLSALFQLLLVELARALPFSQPLLRKESRNSADDFRAVFVEYFLLANYSRPDCSRAQLAALLGVCERQLVRILQRLYHTNFRSLLTEYRMEAAESRRVLQGLSAEETAAAVGYTCGKSFLRAYHRYHGRPYGNRM